MTEANTSGFFVSFVPSEKDRVLHDLARRYHDLTEAYDRKVCSGPIIDGSIMPGDYKQLALVNRNAAEVLKTLALEAAAAGITRQELRRAISHFQ